MARGLIALAAVNPQAASTALAAIGEVAYSRTTNRLGMLNHEGYQVLYELVDQQTAYVTDCRPALRGYPPMM